MGQSVQQISTSLASASSDMWSTATLPEHVDFDAHNPFTNSEPVQMSNFGLFSPLESTDTNHYHAGDNLGSQFPNGGAQHVPGTNQIRCFDHGCNGRAFSSLGNYHRHLKERNEFSRKFFCSRCGRSFSRSTARNLHFEKNRCKSVYMDGDRVQVALPLLNSKLVFDDFSSTPSTERSDSNVVGLTPDNQITSPGASLDSMMSPTEPQTSPSRGHTHYDNCLSESTTADTEQDWEEVEPEWDNDPRWDVESDFNFEHSTHSMDIGMPVQQMNHSPYVSRDLSNMNHSQGAVPNNTTQSHCFDHRCYHKTTNRPHPTVRHMTRNRSSRAFRRHTARNMHYGQRRCSAMISHAQNSTCSQRQFNSGVSLGDDPFGPWSRNCSSGGIDNHCSGCSCRYRTPANSMETSMDSFL